MASLSTLLRNQLERAVKNAREIAELGAKAATEQLAVHEAKAYTHLSSAQSNLRNRLRARARQLGDLRDETGRHGIGHLVIETAYEHWHRMLFARFLAENRVLIHPEGMPVTLEECGELATEEGAADGWELASWYAAKMLPQIFRPDSPVFELKLPRERIQQLERLLDGLPPTVFHASDSLGWVYQFWQAKKKKEVNDSGVKIGADEISAVTQLFTEPYMVDFLLQNTLGAWWVGQHGKDSLPVEMPYLRFLDDGVPAAGTFEGWPTTVADLKVLDPCCGSGHFLVAAFDILARFRMAEESLSPTDACDAVLQDNLYGLEIDERCTQIAVFAVALAAWIFEGAGGHRNLPEFHISCSGLAPRAKKSEWVALAGDDVRLRNGMDRLYSLFQDAPVLGSLVNPKAVGLTGMQRELGVASFGALQPVLEANLRSEGSSVGADRLELSVAASGLASAAQILTTGFDLIATNVPYLGFRDQGVVLREYCEAVYTDSKANLATAVLERCVQLCNQAGVVATVSPNSWFFSRTYADLRRRWLSSLSWKFVARLGSGAFETIGGEIVNVVLSAITNTPPAEREMTWCLDVSDASSAHAKSDQLRSKEATPILQASQRSSTDARIVLEQSEKRWHLGAVAHAYKGLGTGDDLRFRRCFWETPAIPTSWRRLQSSVNETTVIGGCESIVAMEDMRAVPVSGVTIRGENTWGKRGVLVRLVGDLPCCLSLGEPFDQNVAVILPKKEKDLGALWCYCASTEFCKEVRRLDQNLKVTNGTLDLVRFDLDHWREIARRRGSVPEPHSQDPTQWVFTGTISSSTSPLQVAMARLLGYAWPEQADHGFDDLVDDDGIVCLPALRGELPAATRLQTLLGRAFGDDWSPHVLTKLLADVGCNGWSLERWIADKYFEQHCKVFGNRPFIWHVWDGLKGGFSALVNYHKLDRPLLETLTYNYLGDWIRRQEAGGEGSQERLTAAEALKDRLKLILDGGDPGDIFVRWKALAQQPVGWEPDLNDGVRMNIRPFMTVSDVGKKGAGVLRAKPSVNWSKDRGKDPSGAPWFDLGPEYGGKPGDRINDHHLTLDEKHAARRGDS